MREEDRQVGLKREEGKEREYVPDLEEKRKYTLRRRE
jgi:hypothetical protein